MLYTEKETPLGSPVLPEVNIVVATVLLGFGGLDERIFSISVREIFLHSSCRKAIELAFLASGFNEKILNWSAVMPLTFSSTATLWGVSAMAMLTESPNRLSG